MDKRIEEAIRQHPQHQVELRKAARGAGGRLKHIAEAVGAVCRERRITDFGNPFPGGTKEREVWAFYFGDEAQMAAVGITAAQRAEAEDAKMPPFDAMRDKREIERIVREGTGVDLDRRRRLADVREAAKKAWRHHVLRKSVDQQELGA